MQKVTSNVASTVIAIVTLALLAALALIDCWTDVRFNFAIAYPSLLLAGFVVRNRRFLFWLAGLSLAANFSMLAMERADLRAVSQRIISSIAVVTTVLVFDSLIRAWKKLQVDQRKLESSNADLEMRKAEIARQNAALLSQTQALERQRRRFETVFRTLPIGVLVADDPQCTEVRGNAAAAAMYNAPVDANFSPFAAMEMRIRRILYQGGQAMALDAHPLVRSVRTGQEIRGEEIEVAFNDGRVLSLLVSAAPIYASDSQIAGGVSAFMDITALKRIEQELDRRRRLAEEESIRKSRFLAAASHDIRTPVNAIGLLAELIQRSAHNPALQNDIPDLARDLRGSALSLLELVSDVLDLARFDSGRIDLQESEFWLGETIADECRQLQPLARGKSLELLQEPVDPPIRMRTDRIKLGRVIGNLIGNAIKFTDIGSVTVRARIDSNQRVRIDVIDTGVGISAKNLTHVFDEYFQLRKPDRDRNKGMGLGLTICKRLVDAMGGKLDVRSEMGKGSEFTLTLPASALVPMSPDLSGNNDGPTTVAANVAADSGARGNGD